MEKQTEAFLSIRDLNVIYTSGKKIVRAVNGISLDLQKGETLGLVGETGAGKTTLAKAILSVLPNPPAKVLGGSIFFKGQNLLELSEEQMLKIRGDQIAMIFQDPMTALNPIMTVGSQIMEVLELHNTYTKQESEKKAGEMLELVGIPAVRGAEYPHQFSGGMKQRVVIAMALACSPSLLLADEPTTALDVTIQAQVLELIRELKRKYNTSMLLITHDLGIIAETCDKVAVIYAGQIVEYGDKEDIYIHTAHPYTQGLFDALPKTAAEGILKPIQGLPPDPTNLPSGCSFSPRCPYADDKCCKEEPDFVELSEGHFCRCLKPLREGGTKSCH